MALNFASSGNPKPTSSGGATISPVLQAQLDAAAQGQVLENYNPNPDQPALDFNPKPLRTNPAPTRRPMMKPLNQTQLGAPLESHSSIALNDATRYNSGAAGGGGGAMSTRSEFEDEPSTEKDPKKKYIIMAVVGILLVVGVYLIARK